MALLISILIYLLEQLRGGALRLFSALLARQVGGLRPPRQPRGDCKQTLKEDESGVIGIALFATDGLGTNRNAGAKVGTRQHRSLARQLRLITECAFATLRAAAVSRARSRTDIAPPPPQGTPPDDDLPRPAAPGLPTRIKRRFQKLVACGELRKAANALTPEEPSSLHGGYYISPAFPPPATARRLPG